MLRRRLRVITILHTRSTGINSDFFGDFFEDAAEPRGTGVLQFLLGF